MSKNKIGHSSIPKNFMEDYIASMIFSPPMKIKLSKEIRICLRTNELNEPRPQIFPRKMRTILQLQTPIFDEEIYLN